MYFIGDYGSGQTIFAPMRFRLLLFRLNPHQPCSVFFHKPTNSIRAHIPIAAVSPRGGDLSAKQPTRDYNIFL